MNLHFEDFDGTIKQRMIMFRGIQIRRMYLTEWLHQALEPYQKLS